MSASVPVKKDPLLWKACYEGNEELAMNHIKAGSGLEELGGERKTTPLLEAVFQLELVLCKVLVQRGAAVRGTDNAGGGILHMAAQKDNANVLEWALEEGAKNGIGINDRNNWGATPLLQSLLSGAIERAGLLV